MLPDGRAAQSLRKGKASRRAGTFWCVIEFTLFSYGSALRSLRSAGKTCRQDLGRQPFTAGPLAGRTRNAGLNFLSFDGLQFVLPRHWFGEHQPGVNLYGVHFFGLTLSGNAL